MGISNIIKGHWNELFNNEGELAKHRMDICRECPLYKSSDIGPICNPSLWLNPETNETANIQTAYFHKGCGCRLNAKTRDPESTCPAFKW